MRTLTSSRVVLRPWQAEDADFLVDLYSHTEVVRFLGAASRSITTREQVLASVQRRRDLDDPVLGIWAICAATHGSDEKVVGNLLLKPIPLSGNDTGDTWTDQEIEIGWHLHPDAWGHGYATEAARLVLNDALARGLSRIIAVTHPDNLASQAVCRRLRMQPLGLTDRYYDTQCALFVLEADPA